MIPAPFRKIISAHYTTKLFVTNALFDRCLEIYPQEEWVKLEDKVRDLPKMDRVVQQYRRKVIASAQECELDKQGRILIPASLREDAGLHGDIAIVGQIEKMELWDRKEWDAAVDFTGVDQQAVADKLASYGL